MVGNEEERYSEKVVGDLQKFLNPPHPPHPPPPSLPAINI